MSRVFGPMASTTAAVSPDRTWRWEMPRRGMTWWKSPTVPQTAAGMITSSPELTKDRIAPWMAAIPDAVASPASPFKLGQRPSRAA